MSSRDKHTAPEVQAETIGDLSPEARRAFARYLIHLARRTLAEETVTGEEHRQIKIGRQAKEEPA